MEMAVSAPGMRIVVAPDGARSHGSAACSGKQDAKTDSPSGPVARCSDARCSLGSLLVSATGASPSVVGQKGRRHPGGLPPHVPEPVRSRELNSSRSGGLGLGRFIVKQVVSAHGGTIEWKSQPSDGTKISISLPS